MSSLTNTSPVRNRTVAHAPAVFILACMLTGMSVLLGSCASSGGASSGNGTAKTAPSWVTDPGSVYPESEWLTAVEYGADRQAAQAAAVSSLAKIFRQDVKSETTAFQRYVDAVLNDGSGSEFSESREYAQQVVTTSDIDSLMGVTVSDVWTASGGTVYALARINRRQAASGYSAMISENEQAVLSLIESAENNPGTFDAYESLGFASDIALVNDNFLDILSVLDPNMALIRRPSYGNAVSVKQLTQDAARTIVISVDISGDADGRIASAFASCFSDRGFRTAAAGTEAAGYVLAGSFQVQELDMSAGTANKFVRYILTASLRSVSGAEIISYSANERDGHLTFGEARQRSIRTAEQGVKQDFGVQFDAYLASLL